MKTSLPSITKIGYLACSEVSPDILLRYKANIPIVVYGVITPITFFGNPMCDAVSEYENKGRVEHTTLKFSTVDDLYRSPYGRREPSWKRACRGKS